MMSQTRYCGYKVMISGVENSWIYVAVLTAVTLQWGTIASTNCGSFTLDSIVLLIKFYPVHICAPASLYQTNTDKRTHNLPNHHFISNMCNSSMFQHFKGHLQGVRLIHTSSVGQQIESPVAKFNLACTAYCIM
jgi:hypothetical protein